MHALRKKNPTFAEINIQKPFPNLTEIQKSFEKKRRILEHTA